jgi:hypothetical protein
VITASNSSLGLKGIILAINGDGNIDTKMAFPTDGKEHKVFISYDELSNKVIFGIDNDVVVVSSKMITSSSIFDQKMNGVNVGFWSEDAARKLNATITGPTKTIVPATPAPTFVDYVFKLNAPTTMPMNPYATILATAGPWLIGSIQATINYSSSLGPRGIVLVINGDGTFDTKIPYPTDGKEHLIHMGYDESAKKVFFGVDDNIMPIDTRIFKTVASFDQKMRDLNLGFWSETPGRELGAVLSAPTRNAH